MNPPSHPPSMNPPFHPPPFVPPPPAKTEEEQCPHCPMSMKTIDKA